MRFISVLIWSIRCFIILWNSERSFGGCVVIVWDDGVGFVWGEWRCYVLG